jgi:hypothetical protein
VPGCRGADAAERGDRDHDQTGQSHPEPDAHAADPTPDVAGKRGHELGTRLRTACVELTFQIESFVLHFSPPFEVPGIGEIALT